MSLEELSGLPRLSLDMPTGSPLGAMPLPLRLRGAPLALPIGSPLAALPLLLHHPRCPLPEVHSSFRGHCSTVCPVGVPATLVAVRFMQLEWSRSLWQLLPHALPGPVSSEQTCHPAPRTIDKQACRHSQVSGCRMQTSLQAGPGLQRHTRTRQPPCMPLRNRNACDLGPRTQIEALQLSARSTSASHATYPPPRSGQGEPVLTLQGR